MTFPLESNVQAQTNLCQPGSDTRYRWGAVKASNLESQGYSTHWQGQSGGHCDRGVLDAMLEAPLSLVRPQPGHNHHVRNYFEPTSNEGEESHPASRTTNLKFKLLGSPSQQGVRPEPSQWPPLARPVFDVQSSNSQPAQHAPQSEVNNMVSSVQVLNYSSNSNTDQSWIDRLPGIHELFTEEFVRMKWKA